MTDNEKKDTAQAYRIAAKRLREADTVVPALSLEQWAKELDPPRPSPGTVVWWRWVNDSPIWKIGEVHPKGEGVMVGIYSDDVDIALWHNIEYKPARIAGPDEVSIPLDAARAIAEEDPQYSRSGIVCLAVEARNALKKQIARAEAVRREADGT